MRLPLPKNKLVAFTLAGALLTAVVAGGLAFPIPGVTGSADAGGDSGTAPTDIAETPADAPTPNQDFTPAVQMQTGYEEEHEADEEGSDEERAEHEADEEGGDEERAEDYDDEDEDDEEDGE